MASDADALAQARLETLKQQHRGVVAGLFWGFLVLGLLTGWLFAKDWEDASPIVIGTAILALLTLVLAVWQFRLGRTAGPGPAEADEVLRRGRRLVARALFAVGGILLALMLWLVVQRGLETAFPEVSSGVVLALIAVGAGLFLVAAPEILLNQEQFLQRLTARRQPLLIGLLIVGGAFFVISIVIIFTTGVRVAFPEVAGAGCLGLVLIGAGLWLLVNGAAPLTPTRLRILILTVGGLVGLVIAVMTIVRAFLWWDEVFAGGFRTWQGPGAWRLWLCFYVEMLGLALIFASLLFAYADIRVNVVLRRLLFGYNTVLTGLLLLAILVVLNVTVYAYYPYTFEWTRTRGLYSLSDKSKNLLENLKEPVTLYVVMGPGSDAYRDMRNLLQNVQIYTNKVQVEYISPDQQIERFKQLIERFPKMIQEARTGGRGLLVVYGPDTGKSPPPHAFIPAASLVDVRPAGKGRPGEEPKVFREFKGEDQLMTELRLLSRGGERPVIYFTQGHGELNIRNNRVDDQDGAGLFVGWLKKKRYEPRGLVWGPPPKKGADPQTTYAQKTSDEPLAVPKDAMTVIIAQPLAVYEKEVLEALGKYLQSRGRLMVLMNMNVNPTTDTAVETGLEDFLRKYGVELGKNYILTVRRDEPRISQATPPLDSSNPIATFFRKKDFPVRLARTVRVQPGQGTMRGETLLEVASPPNPRIFWAETNLQTIRNPIGYLLSLTRQQVEDRASPEPLPVGVAVTDKDRPLLVVFGDAVMISNDDRIRNVPYFDLMSSSLEWLAGRPENIGIEPRKDTFFKFRSPTIHFGRMVWLPSGLILLTLLGVGAGVWVVRRR